MKQIELPENWDTEVHQGLEVAFLDRPTRNGKPFPGGQPYVGDTYAVARYITYVDIYDENANLIGSGQAICSPQDKFNKELGIRIATGRAIKDYELRRKVIDVLKKNPFNNHVDVFGEPDTYIS